MSEDLALRELAGWWEVEHRAAVEAGGGSEVTHERGTEAIRVVAEQDASRRLRELWFGEGVPTFDDSSALELRDPGLDEAQRHAVQRAAQAREVLLIHGPPGTGKTRTLVEIVRQALRRRERILVTAPSNVAVDNLSRRLAAHRVAVLRLGKPDVVAGDLHPFTLHHRQRQQEEMKEATRKFEDAGKLARGGGRRGGDPRRRMGQLRREAHQLQDLARAKVMRRARVVCATASGVDAVPLGDEPFDLVILDEATQAPAPLALAALVRGQRAILAGDPEQLPPTVVAQDADVQAGLSRSLFESATARWPSIATVMLTTQYRMPEALMAFPSRQHYGGRLEAGLGNRERRLDELLPAPLDGREGQPWIFIDSSEHGATERQDEGTSYHNPQHRALVATELSRLLARGLAAADIAVICPYAAQVEALRGSAPEWVADGLEIATVDAFQGREKEVVIVDLVRSNARGELGFLRDVRRTNVAITRAKRQLILIASAATLEGHPYYRALLDAAREAGAWTTASERPSASTSR